MYWLTFGRPIVRLFLPLAMVTAMVTYAHFIKSYGHHYGHRYRHLVKNYTHRYRHRYRHRYHHPTYWHIHSQKEGLVKCYGHCYGPSEAVVLLRTIIRVSNDH